MLKLIVFIITLSIVVIFSVQNAGPVAVSFLSWHFEASLAIVIALSVLGGIITGMTILSWIRMRRSARKKKELGRDASL
jgi:putative membrane protein